MLNRAQVKKIIDTTIDLAGSKCDAVEVSVTGSNIATSRFANNHMTQNQAPDTHTLSIRVIDGGKQIRLSTCDTSINGLKSVVDNALGAVKFSEPDEQIQDLVSSSQLDMGAYEEKRKSILDKKTIRCSAKERAMYVKEIIDIAKASDLVCAGIVSSGGQFDSYGNSLGHFCFHQESSGECSITMASSDSTGWAKRNFASLKDVNPVSLAKTARDKALSAQEPRDIEPGKYTAILEPSAVVDLLGFLRWDFAGTSHVDKQSCFLNKLGERVLGENINIEDNVHDELQTGSLFDAEGINRRRVNLVQNGVIDNLVFGRRSASLLQTNTTGHGLPEPSIYGEYPMNLKMEGGNFTVEDMIKSTQKGILLSRVWYVRTVDPARKSLTGMTRDGTYMVENGDIAYSVKNLRFNISLIDLLNSVDMLGVPVRAAGEEGFPAVVPALKVNDFNFTEVTRF